MSGAEARVLAVLAVEPLEESAVAERAGIDPAEAHAALASLEFRDLVRSVSGLYYPRSRAGGRG